MLVAEFKNPDTCKELKKKSNLPTDKKEPTEQTKKKETVNKKNFFSFSFQSVHVLLFTATTSGQIYPSLPNCDCQGEKIRGDN